MMSWVMDQLRFRPIFSPSTRSLNSGVPKDYYDYKKMECFWITFLSVPPPLTIEIKPFSTVIELSDELAKLSGELLVESLDNIDKNNVRNIIVG